MNEQRKEELDILISGYTKEFKNNANTEGRFGVLYLSCDTNKNNIQMSLECARKPFIRMLISLMDENELIAEDMIKAVDQYQGRDPLNLKVISI